ncbi:hypothetical protein ABK040_013118 [Willaertia magna]
MDDEDEVIEKILTTDNTSLNNLSDLLDDWESSDDENADTISNLQTRNNLNENMNNLLNVNNQLITINDVNKMSYAKDTYKFKKQVKKHWYNYLKYKLKENDKFNNSKKKYAETLKVVFQYMLDIRRDRYSYSTIFSYSYNQDKKYRLFLRGLRRLYGKQVSKVEPLLNIDRDIMVNYLDININRQALLRSLILQARSRGMRGDSFEYMKLKNVKFIPVIIKKNGKSYFVLNSRFEIEKDKILLKNPRMQMLIGNNNLIKCPNISLAFYLFYFRQAFVGKDFMKMITKPTKDDWKFKKEVLNQSLYVQTDGKSPLTSENMSECICQLAEKVWPKDKSKRYRMRSL